MANLRDIKKRINSVKSTKQITRTMEMVATAKIRKATDRVVAATPYSQAMLEMLGNLAGKASGDSHPLLANHTEKKNAIFIVIASDRGLAGAFNQQVLRAAEKKAKAYAAEGIQTSYILCGKKAIGYFAYRGVTPDMQFAGLSADPTFDQASRIASYVRDLYEQGKVDEVILWYNHARNAADQDLRTEQILPVEIAKEEAADAAEAEAKAVASFDFEPDEAAVLNKLLPAYVETMVYHGLIDSAAGEQGARRKAMKSATDNATEISNTLQRQYNRARQGAITTELNEIVAGAAAQKKEE
ncbi:MAG: ATP synthase F1 subunit gamma [Coriobacteriales bacterium]|nr:ATP synthase F1 subunit gamma [Coriobacteriales bacterium]